MSGVIAEIDAVLERLFPLTRSLTGEGNRETLRVLRGIVPLEIKEYPCGSPVYDWVIPDEWRVRDAWIKDAAGNKLVDFQRCNIHLVSYSEPLHRQMTFDELAPRLHRSEELPEAIPYRTSYYCRDWGFCVTQAQYHALERAPGPLEVMVDSEFDAAGSLTVGELLIPGESAEEVLISTYFCHPSLANDNLSGTVMTAFLARELLKRERRHYSYRIVWVPETVGAVAYCARNETAMKRIRRGLVVTCVGGPGPFGYKQSVDAEDPINALIEEVLEERAAGEWVRYPFDIHGSDERQYSSQGFRINVASLTKDKYYEYPYYHTSLDDLAFVRGEHLAASLALHLEVLERLDGEVFYRNLQPHCEVMLSKHGIYPATGGAFLPDQAQELDARLWLLFLCDGNTSLRRVAARTGLPLAALRSSAELLVEKGVMERGTAVGG
ncbi:DUF4910 domain-containing protein [Endothiovibrio diazotrophicus]